MAYGIKYRIQYKRLSGGTTIINIHDKELVADNITELTADSSPLEISYSGSFENIYEPVIGSGATIRVVASPLSLLDLFTEDPQRYVVKIYNGAVLMWQGFVNSEIYSENYSYSNELQVPITIQCNDGLQVLENITYDVNISGYVSGNITIAGTLGAILGALNISFTTVYLSADISVKEGSETNLFIYLQTASENYIDEKGVAMSCRKVIETIFSGIGLVVRFKGAGIYIYDPICLHDTANGKSYTRATFGDETVINTLGGYLDISNGDISWGRTGSQMDITPSKSEIILKYDPYNFCDYEYNFNDSVNWTTAGTFTDQTGWYYNSTVVFDGWTTGYDYNSVGVKEELYSEPTYMLQLINAVGGYMYHVAPGSNISEDARIGIKVSMTAFAQTKDDSANIYSAAASAATINRYYVQFTLQVGGKYWKADHWESGATGDYKCMMIFMQDGVTAAQFAANNSLSIINDVWTSASKIIPCSLGTGGEQISEEITLTVLDAWTSFTVVPAGNWDNLLRIFIKDIRIEIVNIESGSNIGNYGLEKKGRINTNLTGKTSFTIDTLSGTGLWGSSRGAFKDTAGKNVLGLYRTQQSTLTEDLLLESIVSQYQSSRLKLSGILDVAGLDIDFKLIQDIDYLPTQSFYVVSSTYNDKEEIATVEMIELTDTREVIE